MLQRQAVPLLEFDDAEAYIQPRVSKTWTGDKTFPDACVLSYVRDAATALVTSGEAEEFHTIPSITGDEPIYRVWRGGHDVALLNIGVGAPIAASRLEHLHAYGCRNFISFGGAGMLIPDVHVGHVLLPIRALRDEGTSYHYLPPSRFVDGDLQVVESMERVLERENVEHRRVTTWTTDAFFRETPDKIALRREEGCACVDMEASAFMAVAKFRKLRYGALFFAGDSLSGPQWDKRNWTQSEKRGFLLELALSCAAELIENPL
jgi:uridine phosphorylase